MKNQALIILLLGSVLASGQNANQLSFALGMGIPLGDYNKISVNDINSGYAKNGRNLNISYSRRLGNTIALQLTFMGISNEMNNQPIALEYLNNFPRTSFINIQSRVWRSNVVLLGVSKKVQFADGPISLEPSMHAGYTHTRRPGLSIYGYRNDQTIPPSENESDAASLGLQFGLNSYYSINDQMSIFIETKYFTTSPKFNFIRTPATDRNAPFNPQHITYTQEIQLLMLNAGLRYSFKR